MLANVSLVVPDANYIPAVTYTLQLITNESLMSLFQKWIIWAQMRVQGTKERLAS